MDPDSGLSYPEPEPNTFSFNSPYGACPHCGGLGRVAQIDMNKLIPDPKKSLRDGGIEVLGKYSPTNHVYPNPELMGRHYDFTLDTPIGDLSEEAMNLGATEGEINKYNQFSANGDTANIWTGDASAVLLPYPMRNRIDFNIKADSTYKKGDTFMLNMMLDFYYQSGTKEAEGCLLLVYDNDSVACRTNRLTVAGLNQMRLESDTSHLVKEVKGYIYLARGGEETTTLRLLFIRDLQLIRFHKPEVKKEEEEDKMKTDTVVRGNMMEVESDSIPASADTLSRFGRALPPGGRTMPAQEKTIVPRKDLKLKTN
jgi:hypothetical protein